jgi:hypothetical protein
LKRRRTTYHCASRYYLVPGKGPIFRRELKLKREKFGKVQVLRAYFEAGILKKIAWPKARLFESFSAKAFPKPQQELGT